jgi:plasmid stabilization system protein ParE
VTFKVRLTRDAEADLDRLFDFLVERELITPFGRSGYVALFEIED